MLQSFPEISRNQRVVVQHSKGPHKGLYQILGHTDDLPKGQVPSTTLATLIPDGRPAQIDLVASKPRYLLYREFVAPEGLGAFDRRQR
jgi:hypothetical protein